jgi:tRNA 2-thiouridine synthesizing protein A
MPELRERRLDLRGLEPPQPLVRSLEAAAELHPGEDLVLVTDRQPVHLLPLLVERGYDIDSLALEDHHETLVRKPI